MLLAKTKFMNLPVILFENQKEWTKWLSKNHKDFSGLWLRIAKKDSGVNSVSYPDAVDTALCYGWIDGLKQKYNETTWIQKFTPRSPKSMWSKINREKAEALIKSKKMKSAGQKAIENAKKSGMWALAYDSHRTSKIPPDFQKALDKNPIAREFFKTVGGSNRYAILFRIQTAKRKETREQRIEKFIDMLNKKKKIHP